MSRAVRIVSILLACLCLVHADRATALEKCTATIRPADGTIFVSASGLAGTLLWGGSSGNETNAFDNASTCIAGTPLAAHACRLGPLHSTLAITPPPLCRLFLTDGTSKCTAVVKGCTPGLRPLVELPSRFVDNGDGTVTDTKTGLMWEQKTFACNTGDPECLYTEYTWTDSSDTALFLADGTLFTDFLPHVNGWLCSTTPCRGLGGHSDWRLPTISELETISGPELVPAGCGGAGAQPICPIPVLGPAVMSVYWSASVDEPATAQAWSVGLSFFGNRASPSGKYNSGFARAVRNER